MAGATFGGSVRVTASDADSRITDSVAPSDVADARAPARRTAPVQQTPAPPPPVTAYPDGVSSCLPGQYIRSVDTAGERLVTFTFDDGPWPVTTEQVMDAFDARGLTATFFMIGVNLQKFPHIGRQVVERGFAVGAHSITHQYNWAANSREVIQSRDLIRNVLGVDTPYWRTPGLGDGPPIDRALVAAGLCNLSTSIGMDDVLVPRRSAAQLCANFANRLHPGMIVLLHDGGNVRPTVDAVPCMLDIAQARGYRVVSLAELLAAGPAIEGRRSGR